jgi:hypothetical protein
MKRACPDDTITMESSSSSSSSTGGSSTTTANPLTTANPQTIGARASHVLLDWLTCRVKRHWQEQIHPESMPTMENDMLADAAVTLFGAGLGAPEHVQPFMDIFLDEDEKEGRSSRPDAFLPAGRVLTRLYWPLLLPHVPKLLAAAQWTRYRDFPWRQTRMAKRLKLRSICTYTALILAPHVDKLLQLQELERAESFDGGKSACVGESVLLLVVGFFEAHPSSKGFAGQNSDGIVQLLDALFALPRDLLLQHMPEVLKLVLENQPFLASLK